MKVLSRDFTIKEKAMLILLSLVILGLAYYYFVEQPVRDAINTAHAEVDSLTQELSVIDANLKNMRVMRQEMDKIEADGIENEMPSYNSSKAELAMLNDILRETTQYNISFSNVTRNNDQIRRSFSISFNVPTYEALEDIVSKLTTSNIRCLVGDLRCSAIRNRGNVASSLSVSATATFFETMVGGVPDAGLPETKASAR